MLIGACAGDGKATNSQSTGMKRHAIANGFSCWGVTIPEQH